MSNNISQNSESPIKKYFMKIYNKTGGYTTLLIYSNTTVQNICDRIQEKSFYSESKGFGLYLTKGNESIFF